MGETSFWKAAGWLVLAPMVLWIAIVCLTLSGIARPITGCLANAFLFLLFRPEFWLVVVISLALWVMLFFLLRWGDHMLRSSVPAAEELEQSPSCLHGPLTARVTRSVRFALAVAVAAVAVTWWCWHMSDTQKVRRLVLELSHPPAEFDLFVVSRGGADDDLRRLGQRAPGSLIKLLDDSDADCRQVSATWLGRLQVHEAAPKLRLVLQREQWGSVRWDIVRALRELDDVDSIELLRYVQEHDSVHQIRDEARLAVLHLEKLRATRQGMPSWTDTQ
jgi:hypothetical protein